ncbi:hypothetical protein Syun_002960 [Stephania yunnanensis]|uniref:Uncharacterized protein n=1 Tax=Stephania yunnanensis TaxID=152371 RepID=A0AAP0L0B2_9MAGN
MLLTQLLSEEVFDFSRGEMTQQKIKELKQSLNRCFVRSQVFFEAQSTLYNLGTLLHFFFSFRTIFALTFVERYKIETFLIVFVVSCTVH